MLVLSRIDAGFELSSPPKASALSHLVSIGDPGAPLPLGFDNVARKIRLEFYDPEPDDPDDELETIVEKGMHVRFEAGGRPVNLIGLP